MYDTMKVWILLLYFTHYIDFYQTSLTSNRDIDSEMSADTITYEPPIKTCVRTVMSVTVRLDGCRPQKVRVHGCDGYCKSDSSIELYRHTLVPKCDCCKPTSQMVVEFILLCPYRRRKFRPTKIYSAIGCSCTPCMRIFRG